MRGVAVSLMVAGLAAAAGCTLYGTPGQALPRPNQPSGAAIVSPTPPSDPASVTAVTAKGPFKVRFVRSVDVGSMYDTLIWTERAGSHQLSKGRQLIKSGTELQRAQFEGRCKALKAAMPHKGKLRTDCLIKHFGVELGSAPWQLAHKGQILSVTHTDPPLVLLDGSAVSRDYEQVVDMVIEELSPLPSAGRAASGVPTQGKRPTKGRGPTQNLRHEDDRVFGTTVPQHAGASWPINNQELAKVMNEDNPGFVSAAHITGESSLQGAVSHRGIPCLSLSTYAKIGLAKVPGPLHPDARFLQGKMGLRLWAHFPVETSLPPLWIKQRVDMDMVLAIPKAGPDVRLRVRFTEKSVRYTMPVKRSAKSLPPSI